MKRLAITGILVASTLILSGGNVWASSKGGNSQSPSVLTTLMNLLLGNDPTTPVAAGQPNQSCQAFPASDTPGNSAGAPGSPFGGGVADSHYAGSQPQNSKNPASVAQYDVACANQARRQAH
jgi:hypothetical protein